MLGLTLTEVIDSRALYFLCLYLTAKHYDPVEVLRGAEHVRFDINGGN